MLDAVHVLLLVLAALVALATALPLVRAPYWWIRSFDFPRVQIVVLALGAAAGLAAWAALHGLRTPDAVALAALALATLYQTVRIWPYTPLARLQSLPAEAADAERTLRLVISNVLMTNRDGERWLRVVTAADPDLVVAVETDAWWAETTGALAETHPHTVLVPQDDTYGMCVYSRFEIEDVDVRHLVEDEVPSLFLRIRLPGGDRVRCVFLHPRPPRPDVGQDSTLRDAELVLAAREIATFDLPTVVAGDLNDVAWSDTTHLFQKISRLLDPRIGRGLFPTFHADHAWLRYPLDHVFHSDDFTVAGIERLAHVGSDHFPMCITLALDPSREDDQEAPDADADDHADAEEMVDDAEAFKADETSGEKAERLAEDV